MVITVSVKYYMGNFLRVRCGGTFFVTRRTNPSRGTRAWTNTNPNRLKLYKTFPFFLRRKLFVEYTCIRGVIESCL